MIRSFRNAPIRDKLLLAFLLTTGGALAVAGLGIAVADSFLFRVSLKRDLFALSSIVATNSTAAVVFNEVGSAEELLKALRARPHIVAACIFRQNGSLLARYQRNGGPDRCIAPNAQEKMRFEGADLIISRAIMLRAQRVGTLTMRYDVGELSERTRLYGLVIIAIQLASSLLAWLLSSRLRNIIATPISELADVATAVSRTHDYSIRARRLSGDESGLLVDAFNQMLARVQSREAELERVLTSREKALSDARNARDSLKTTLASIGDAVISTDTDGRVVFANAVAQVMLKCHDAVGRRLDEVFHTVNELTRERMESPLSRVLQTGAAVGMANHTVLVSLDGTETPIEDGGAPIRGENGAIEGLVLVFRDVTARRKADQNRRLLASIVESSEDAIISEDLTGRITTWNHGAERVFGYTAAEMVGQPLTLLSPPDRPDEIPALLRRVASGERIHNLQTLRQTRNGKRIHVSISLSPVEDMSGHIIGVSKIARNITERVEAAERLARLNEELKGSNENLARSIEDLEHFAFVASHDLQEPLRMIAVHTQLLIRTHSEAISEDGRKFLDNIIEATRRMRQLLADLLAYEEIGFKIEGLDEAINLNVVLETVQENLGAAIEESGATITVDPLPMVTGHWAHFVPLFQNLVENAIKYRSEKPPLIHIFSRRLEGKVQVVVRDNGIGIDVQYHKKIFSAFKRLHGQKIPGTGIGLAICQRVVERYDGSISVESGEGQGASFILTLPESSIREGGSLGERGETTHSGGRRQSRRRSAS